jgi:hypothetical protein
MTAFYVDARAGNDAWTGDQQKPLKTIQKAAAKAVAGDVVFVLPGAYSGTVKVPKSGTAAKPIAFKSVARHQAVLSGMFEIKGQSHIHITGFRIQKGGYGVRVEGQSQGVVIGGNYFFDTNSSAVSAWGVPFKAQPSLYGWRGVRDITVTDNDFDHCCDGGWNEIASFANGVDGVTMTDNRIFNPGSTANGGEGPDFKCGVKNVRYLRNKHTGLRKVATYVDGGCPESGLYKDPWNGENQNIEIAFNEYLNCGAAINVSSEAAGSCIGVDVHDNWIEGGKAHGVLFYLHPKAKQWAPRTWQHSRMADLTARRNVVIGKPIGFIVNCAIGQRMKVVDNMPYRLATPYQLLAGQYTCDRAVAKTKPVKG